MIVLVRHGESEWNVRFSRTRRDPGIRDAPLTETGRQQARAAAFELRARGVRRLIASPYRRALETASILAEALDAPIAVDPLFGEHAAFSCDEGTPRTELEPLFPHIDLSHVPELWWPELEEPVTAMRRRMGAARAVLQALDGDAPTAVVCHWGVIRALTGQTVANCAIVPFDPHAPWDAEGDPEPAE